MWNSGQIEQILMCWPEEFKADIGETIMSFHGNSSLAHGTQIPRKVGHLAMVGQTSLNVLCPKDLADI